MRVRLIHVKGEDSYGHPRSVPVHSEIRSIVLSYIILRQKYMLDNGFDSPFLFVSKSSATKGHSSNSVRNMKHLVENDLGLILEMRQLRRTFGQRLLDHGVPIESVSVLMGHSTTKTTEEFYARRRMIAAQKDMENLWNSDVTE